MSKDTDLTGCGAHAKPDDDSAHAAAGFPHPDPLPKGEGDTGGRSATFALTRRTLIKAGVAAGGGLMIGFALPGLARFARAGETSHFAPNAWIRIAPDDSVTIVVAKSEMGQGVYTSMPMLVAEELEVDLQNIRMENAPPDQAYVDALLGMQATGSSTSVRSSWKPLREAGAAARMMLIAAAAQTWKVKPGDCRAENGAVLHPASQRRLSYGRLAQDAAKQALPKTSYSRNRGNSVIWASRYTGWTALPKPMAAPYSASTSNCPVC